LRIHDIDADRARVLAAKVAHAHPGVEVTAGAPVIAGADVLVNASPVGMLADARLPIEVASLPRALVVLDAIVKPERTPLIALAERCGCTAVYGREMMRGQIAQMVDFFVSGG
jgi:shikimate dehydrogenase